jgi:toxin ParE1/3/4
VSRKARIRWTHRSIEDLRAIGRYIAEDDPRAARQWVERLRQRAREAASTPKAGRRVPEVERDDIREVLLRSYRIVYRVVREGIEVLTVFEGHRLLPGGAVPEADEE